METLRQNITNLYSSKGSDWMDNLPSIVMALTKNWSLSEITPVSNMTFNYIAKAILNKKEPVVLKISYDEQSMINERWALANLGLRGSIKLIDYNSQYKALLLQQAIPGITLKSLYRDNPNYVMNCYVKTMQKLHHHQQLLEESNPTHMADWLKALDELSLKQIPTTLLNKALELRNKMLSSPKPLIFLHGDLHHDNILKQGNEWVAIDPKGIIGEAEFEIAAFDFMYISETAITDVKNVFEKRVKLLAQKSGLDAQRIKDWVFVRLILMAAWLIEDNGDPSWAIKLAELLD